MSKWTLRRAVVGGATFGAVVLASFVAYHAAMAGPGELIKGDVNLDGKANIGDVEAFIRAMKDPKWWTNVYGRPFSDLLAVADFDADGRVTSRDGAPFCEAIAPDGWPGGDLLPQDGGGLLDYGDGEVDLDIDSDNNSGTAFPDRMEDDEDPLENDPDEPGKLVLVNDDDDDNDTNADKDQSGTVTGEDDLIPLGLEIEPGTATPPIEPTVHYLDYELTYGDDVQVWDDPERGDSGHKINSGATHDQLCWVLGDMNADGAIDYGDLNPFILAQSDFPEWYDEFIDGTGMEARAVYIGDMNCDGSFDLGDINPFTAALQQGAEVNYVPVWMWVEGLQVSLAAGGTTITAAADTDNDDEIDGDDAEPDVVKTTIHTVEPGFPPAWGGSATISPFSTVNLANGNVITAIPLIGWNPVGPPLQFTLYHNSTVNAYGTDSSAWGFDLGTGWSVSYGAHLVGTSANPTWGDARIVLVGADGSRTAFDYDTDHYDAPPGVYDVLEWDNPASEWTLTTPDLWVSVFDSAGRLVEVQDSSGNVLIVHRDSGNDYRIDYIATADDGLSDGQNPPGTIEHRLKFYYTNDQLSSVEADIEEGTVDVFTRIWSFDYDGSDRLSKIHYPYCENADACDYVVEQTEVEFAYDGTSHRIAKIYPRDGSEAEPPKTGWDWQYTYDTAGRLDTVTTLDLNVGSADDEERYSESFDFATVAEDGLFETTYTDRRSKVWNYRFDGFGNFREVTTPAATPNTRTAEYDDEHNLTARTDELDHTWTYTYGSVGNVATVSSPLTGQDSQTWTLTWEHPTGTPASFYRLTQIADPLDGTGDYVVQYEYEDENDPTLVTLVREPLTQFTPASVTRISYYDYKTPSAAGHVHTVIDANDVRHEFWYDKYGYFEKNKEGLYESGAWTNPVQRGPNANDSNGEPYAISNGSSAGDSGGACQVSEKDANGNVGGTACCLGGGDSWCLKCPADPEDNGDGPLTDIPDWLGTRLTGCDTTTHDYDLVGRPTIMRGCISGGLEAGSEIRYHELDYDAFGRVTEQAIRSDESGPEVLRDFAYTYDADGRVATVLGPDDDTYIYDDYTYDDLGRLESITHALMDTSVAYTYDDAGRLELVEHFAPGQQDAVSKIVRAYDAADRLTSIEHRDGADTALLRIEYVWNRDNTVYTRSEIEYDQGTPNHTAVVTFNYDARKRLTGEVRVLTIAGDPPQEVDVYDLEYEYDQLGNRTLMIDNLGDRVTCYVYDTNWDPDSGQYGEWEAGLCFEPPALASEFHDWATKNNRLVEYREFGAEVGDERPLERTVHYSYSQAGHVTNITILDADAETYKDLYLVYGTNERLWLAIWQQWDVEDNPPEFEDIDVTDICEFRYDGGRQRYLARHWSMTIVGGYPVFSRGAELWTDYLGEQPYIDYEIEVIGEVGTPNEWTRYLAGAGAHAKQEMYSVGDPISFLHGDLIRSTVLMTDDAGAVERHMAYTAFGQAVQPDGQGGWHIGERLPDYFTRYGYGGGWGYESGNWGNPSAGYPGPLALYGENTDLPPVTLLHVGERWYQPGIGRFIQRDPVGLLDGWNVYAYCHSTPLTVVDPLGLGTAGKVIGGAIGTGAGTAVGGVIVTGLGLGTGGAGVLVGAPIVSVCAFLGGWAGMAIGDAIEEGGLSGIGGPYHGGFFCIAEGTLVGTAEGPAVVEDVQLGCLLMGIDERELDSGPDIDGLVALPAGVTAVRSRMTREIIEVVLGDETIVCTAQHPFWVVDQGWVNAGQLNSAHCLMDINGDPVPVVEVNQRVLEKPIRVFDLTVSDVHSFHVGRTKVLVHNKLL